MRMRSEEYYARATSYTSRREARAYYRLVCVLREDNKLKTFVKSEICVCARCDRMQAGGGGRFGVVA